MPRSPLNSIINFKLSAGQLKLVFAFGNHLQLDGGISPWFSHFLKFEENLNSNLLLRVANQHFNRGILKKIRTRPSSFFLGLSLFFCKEILLGNG